MRLIAPTESLYSTNRVRELTGYTWEYLVDVAANSGKLYHPFDVREIGDKKWRHIDNPNDEIKKVQSRLLDRVLRLALLPDFMFGAVRGRDIVGHARTHVGQPSIVSIDLRDCFPRTHDTNIWSVFKTVFNCSDKIASVFTKLTTYQHRLPQGAPSSTYLAQLAIVDMVRDIEVVCLRRRLRLSVYVDDVVWSGKGAQFALGEIVEIVKRHGHRIRNKKKRIMHPCLGEEAVITGIGVGNDLSAPRDYEDLLLARLKRDALDGAISAAENRSVRGQVAYVRRLNPGHGAIYDELIQFLPRVAGEGKRNRKIQVQKCRRAWRHAYRPVKPDQARAAHRLQR